MANLITWARIAILPVLLGLLLVTQAWSLWAAFGLLLAAGVGAMIDGRIARRRGEASPFGAMLDLIAERLLTLVVLLGLVGNGTLRGASLIPVAVLIGRDLLVAGLNRAFPGAPKTHSTGLERVKRVVQFAAFVLLVSPPVGGAQQYDLGRVLLWLSAALTVVSLALYAGHAVRASRERA